MYYGVEIKNLEKTASNHLNIKTNALLVLN